MLSLTLSFPFQGTCLCMQATHHNLSECCHHVRPYTSCMGLNELSQAGTTFHHTLWKKRLSWTLLFWIVAAGLLANLTCILAELYDMQEAMSVTVNPEWVVPYTTDAEEYQNLLDEFLAYVQVSSHAKQACMRTACTS